MIENRIKLPNLYKDTPEHLKPIVGLALQWGLPRVEQDLEEMGFVTKRILGLNLLTEEFPEIAISDLPGYINQFKKRKPTPIIGVTSPNIERDNLLKAGADLVVSSLINSEKLGLVTKKTLISALFTPERTIVEAPNAYSIEVESGMIYKMINGKREIVENEGINPRLVSLFARNQGEIVTMEDIKAVGSRRSGQISGVSMLTNIFRLRNVFGEDAFVTKRGVGYKFVKPQR